MTQQEEIVKSLHARGIEDIAQEIARLTDDQVLRFHTNVHFVLRDKDGNVKQEFDEHNLICTAGKNKLLSVASGEALTAFTYISIGTGTTAAAISDTTLQAEVARSPSQVATNPTAASYQVTYTFPAGVGTGAIAEAGLLDAVSVGNLLARQVFSVINKASTDTLQITWTVS